MMLREDPILWSIIIGAERSIGSLLERQEGFERFEEALENAVFHAPCGWNTNGWPTAAKERSASSIRRAIRTEDGYHARALLAGR